MLKDLNSEISRLKTENAALCAESRELIQEKELREEKASLKSDIQELAVLYRQAIGIIPPWAPVDLSGVVAHSFSYPNAFPVPSGPSPSHPPPLQPITLFGSQSGVPSHSSTLFPCQTPATSQIHHPSTVNASTPYISREQGFNGMSSGSNSGKVDDLIGVVTDLELELPGSTVQKLAPGDKGKQPMNESENVSNRSSLRLYSSQGFQGSSSRNMDDKCKGQMLEQVFSE